MRTTTVTFVVLISLAMAFAAAEHSKAHANGPGQQYVQVNQADDDRIFLYPVPDDFPISQLTIGKSREASGPLQHLRHPIFWIIITPLIIAATTIAWLAKTRRQRSQQQQTTFPSD